MSSVLCADALMGFESFSAHKGHLCVAPSPPARRRRRGVVALGLETGRGRRRVRFFDHQPQGGTAWGWRWWNG